MKLMAIILTVVLATFSVFTASAKTLPILQINDDYMPVCYNGDAETALQELISLDFDPALSADESTIENGVLKGVQYDENGSLQRIIEVPLCEGNDGKEIIETEGEFQTSITYSCFETMGAINERSTPISTTASADVLAMVSNAELDAAKRVKEMNKGVAPETKILMSGKYLTGIKVIFKSSEDDEYGDYFLYQTEVYSSAKKLELLSAHYGDDQGPTMNIF